jgi:hypothetical protein
VISRVVSATHHYDLVGFQTENDRDNLEQDRPQYFLGEAAVIFLDVDGA